MACGPNRYHSAAARARLLMVLGVMLRRFVPVMGRMQFMRMRHVGVMARLLVIA